MRGVVLGEKPSIAARDVIDHGQSAIIGKPVGIERDTRRTPKPLRGVQHGLVLQAGVVKLADAVPQSLAHRQRRDIRVGKRIFSLYPGLRIRGIEFLEPPIGIGDLGSMIVVDHAAPGRAGIPLGTHPRLHQSDRAIINFMISLVPP